MEKQSTSHGIVLFTINEKNQVVFLVAKRRYTYAYIEFLFRKHHSERQNLVHDMTSKEIAQLLTYKFERLWEDYHLESYSDANEESYTKYAHDLFIESMKKYRIKLLRSLDVPRGNENKKLIWEFPKGKKNYFKQGLECALREFKEETGIDTKNFVSINGAYLENYKGDDERPYSTMLYPMFIKNHKKLLIHKKKSKYTFSNDYISPEIKKIRWMDEEQCKKVLPESKMKFVRYIIQTLKVEV